MVGSLQQPLYFMTVTGPSTNTKASRWCFKLEPSKMDVQGLGNRPIRNGYFKKNGVLLKHNRNHCASLTRTIWKAFGCLTSRSYSEVAATVNWSKLSSFPHQTKRVSAWKRKATPGGKSSTHDRTGVWSQRYNICVWKLLLSFFFSCRVSP